MKNLIIFFIFIIIGFVGSYWFIKYNYQPTKTVISPIKNVPTTNSFSVVKAPSESLKANIISFSGEVQYESRSATEPAKLTEKVKTLAQAEYVITGEDGKIELKFNKDFQIKVEPKTKLELIQTLKNSFVFRQNQGIVDYQKNDAVPLGIRSLNLLLQVEKADFTLSIDEETEMVYLEVISGTVTAAYNDLDYLSHVETVEKGQELKFDNVTRTVKIE